MNFDHSKRSEKTQEIAYDLIAAGEDNVLNNPPDITAGYGLRAEEIEEGYENAISHASYYYDIDDNYFYFGGEFEIELDPDRVAAGEYVIPDYFRDTDLEDALRTEADIYGIDEIDISETSTGEVSVRIIISTDGYEPNPDGYDAFLSELETMDEKFTRIKRIVEKYFVSEGYMTPSEYDAAKEEIADLATTLENFEIDRISSMEDRTVFITRAQIPLFLPAGRDSMGKLGHGGMLNKLDIKLGGNPERRPAYPGNNEFFKRLMKELQGLNRSLIALLQKQLQLPIADLPPKIIEELSIPDNLVITFHPTAETSTDQRAFATVTFSLDPEITREVIDASVAMIKFMDKNYNEIEKAISNVLTEMWREWEAARAKADAQKKALDDLPDDAIPGTLGDPQPAHENNLKSEIEDYFNRITEELPKRSRQKGVYQFYCMIGYRIESGEGKARGLEEIVSDIRSIPSVTIVTVAISNQRIGPDSYIAGLKVKFIPSFPGILRSPEDAKLKILTSLRSLTGVSRVFKVSSGVERIDV